MELSLEETLKPVRGRRRRYLLYRIAEVGAETAKDLVGIKKSTMNSWFKDDTFIEIHRQLTDLTKDYKKEAINMLRRDTQLAAVMLEADIIKKIAEEVRTGSYNLLKTGLAKEVYSKLISDLDVPVHTPQVMSWEENLTQIFEGNGGHVIEGQFKTTSGEAEEHQQSYLVEASQQETI